jgi:hypothetical protein
LIELGGLLFQMSSVSTTIAPARRFVLGTLDCHAGFTPLHSQPPGVAGCPLDGPE